MSLSIILFRVLFFFTNHRLNIHVCFILRFILTYTTCTYLIPLCFFFAPMNYRVLSLSFFYFSILLTLLRTKLLILDGFLNSFGIVSWIIGLFEHFFREEIFKCSGGWVAFIFVDMNSDKGTMDRTRVLWPQNFDSQFFC